MSCQNDLAQWRWDWSDELSVGIPQIDAEHQQFILLVNALNEAISNRMPVEEIKIRMQAILLDAVAHFAHEEALFEDCGYPQAEEHAMKHVQVLHALHEIMGGFTHGGEEYEWINAGLQVKQALVEHLLAEDMKYRDYGFTRKVGSIQKK